MQHAVDTESDGLETRDASVSTILGAAQEQDPSLDITTLRKTRQSGTRAVLLDTRRFVVPAAPSQRTPSFSQIADLVTEVTGKIGKGASGAESKRGSMAFTYETRTNSVTSDFGEGVTKDQSRKALLVSVECQTVRRGPYELDPVELEAIRDGRKEVIGRLKQQGVIMDDRFPSADVMDPTLLEQRFQQSRQYDLPHDRVSVMIPDKLPSSDGVSPDSLGRPVKQLGPLALLHQAKWMLKRQEEKINEILRKSHSRMRTISMRVLPVNTKHLDPPPPPKVEHDERREAYIKALEQRVVDLEATIRTIREDVAKEREARQEPPHAVAVLKQSEKVRARVIQTMSALCDQFLRFLERAVEVEPTTDADRVMKDVGSTLRSFFAESFPQLLEDIRQLPRIVQPEVDKHDVVRVHDKGGEVVALIDRIRDRQPAPPLRDIPTPCELTLTVPPQDVRRASTPVSTQSTRRVQVEKPEVRRQTKHRRPVSGRGRADEPSTNTSHYTPPPSPQPHPVREKAVDRGVGGKAVDRGAGGKAGASLPPPLPTHSGQHPRRTPQPSPTAARQHHPGPPTDPSPPPTPSKSEDTPQKIGSAPRLSQSGPKTNVTRDYHEYMAAKEIGAVLPLLGFVETKSHRAELESLSAAMKRARVSETTITLIQQCTTLVAAVRKVLDDRDQLQQLCFDVTEALGCPAPRSVAESPWEQVSEYLVGIKDHMSEAIERGLSSRVYKAQLDWEAEISHLNNLRCAREREVHMTCLSMLSDEQAATQRTRSELARLLAQRVLLAIKVRRLRRLKLPQWVVFGLRSKYSIDLLQLQLRRQGLLRELSRARADTWQEMRRHILPLYLPWHPEPDLAHPDSPKESTPGAPLWDILDQHLVLRSSTLDTYHESLRSAAAVLGGSVHESAQHGKWLREHERIRQTELNELSRVKRRLKEREQNNASAGVTPQRNTSPPLQKGDTHWVSASRPLPPPRHPPKPDKPSRPLPPDQHRRPLPPSSTPAAPQQDDLHTTQHAPLQLPEILQPSASAALQRVTPSRPAKKKERLVLAPLASCTFHPNCEGALIEGHPAPITFAPITQDVPPGNALGTYPRIASELFAGTI